MRFGDGVTPPRALFGKSAALSSCKVCTSGNKLFNGVVDGVCPACKGSVAIEFFGEVLALKPTNVHNIRIPAVNSCSNPLQLVLILK